MRPNTEYKELLQNAGISVEAMAHHLEQKGFGPAQQWRYAIATGDASRFTKRDRKNAWDYIQQNPQLIQQLQYCMQQQAQ